MGDAARAIVDVAGSELVIRVQVPAATSQVDRLIQVSKKTCEAEGFEVGGIRRLIADGKLPSTTIGRGTFVRYSDLLALPALRPPKESAPLAPVDDVDAALSRTAARIAKRGR